MKQIMNQIDLCPEKLSVITGSLCSLLKCDHSNIKDVICRKAKGTSINTSLGKLHSTPLSIIRKLVDPQNKTESSSDRRDYISILLDTHDIRSNVYEGGFKVWEGAKDLINFLDRSHLDGLILNNVSTKFELNILELGAGAALPSIFCLNKLTKANSNFNLHLQDFNEEVLDYLFLSNLIVNIDSVTIENLVKSRKIREFWGPWSDFHSELAYDLIIMSETIYDIESYDSLHHLIVKHLKNDGVVILATKDTYFGCSGSLFDWEDFINKKKCLSIESKLKISDSIPRSIIKMKSCRQTEKE